MFIDFLSFLPAICKPKALRLGVFVLILYSVVCFSSFSFLVCKVSAVMSLLDPPFILKV